MPGIFISTRVQSAVLLLLCLPLTGCLTGESFEAPGSRGIPLSQAMKSSASGSTTPLHGADSGGGVATDVEVDAAATGGGLSLLDDDSDQALEAPVDVAYSVPFNGEFQSITRFTVTPICLENDRANLGLFVSGDVVNLSPGSLAASAIKNTLMFETGVSGRFYLNPAHAFISPYISANAAYQLLTWDYLNPVYVNGDQINSDSLEGIGAYAGFGIAFNRSHHLSLFGEAGFGGTVFLSQTGQGFDNDVFHDFGYFSVKAGLCIKF